MNEEPDIHQLIGPYALDALDALPRRRFEAHLATCRRCRSELSSLEGTAATLALDVQPVEPPPALRARIVAAARGEGRRAETGASNRLLLGPRRIAGAARPRRSSVPLAAGIAATAVAAVVAIGVWGFTLAREVDRIRVPRVDERVVAIVTDPRAKRYPLVGGSGQLVVNSVRDAALVVVDLRRAPRERTYEAWVVTSGSARPAGTFAGGGERSLIALTRKVPRGALVAVSMEPAGGSARPTGALLLKAETR